MRLPECYLRQEVEFLKEIAATLMSLWLPICGPWIEPSPRVGCEVSALTRQTSHNPVWLLALCGQIIWLALFLVHLFILLLGLLSGF